MSEQQVLQYNSQMHSLEEAQNMVDGLRLQEGCMDARRFGCSVTAHFDMDIPQDAVPDGCRLVPRSVVAFLKRHDEKG